MVLLARHILVSGKVQGVGYRDAARRRAEALGLRGWVRNLDDGRVEIVAQGDGRAVEAFLSWCRQGPPQSRVSQVDARPHPTSPQEGFAIVAGQASSVGTPGLGA